MGIKLIVEFMDFCPAGLTATEWKAMVVMLEDANDASRLTWSSVADPKILRRIGLSPAAWTNLRGVLVRKGALEVAVPGKRGQVAKYRVPNFAPMGHGIDEEFEMPHGIDEASGLMPHETDEESAEKVMGSMTPTPPNTPSNQPPSPEPRPSPANPPEREGGGIASLNDNELAAYRTLTRITATDHRLTLGENELADLIPLAAQWLQRSPAETLHAALTAGLPTVVGNPAGLLRKRLAQKMPPPPQIAEQPDHCTRPNCDPITHMLTLPDHSLDYCPTCHPTGRARARRTHGAAA